MSEGGPKKVEFSRSSLIGLKAELLKKQEEVKKKKALPQHSTDNFKPPPAKPIDDYAIPSTSKKVFTDNLEAVDTDEMAAYKKTKAALEKKTALYEHLSSPIGDSEVASNFLVDFAAKKRAHEPYKLHEYVSEPFKLNEESQSDEEMMTLRYEDDFEDDNEWTEYTDVLGRTRRCLKEDVEMFKKKDKELLRSANLEQKHEVDPNEPEFLRPADKPLLVQKTHDYLHSLRERWDIKEREMLAKEKDIHYQDVLFDEARMHGVAYYSFSTEEAERKRQMEEIMKERENTLRAQKKAEETRREKEEAVAAKLRAAKARQREKAGLPPEEPDDTRQDFNSFLLEFLHAQRQRAEEKAKETERKIQEQIEKERQKLRDTHVRDWDKGKPGVSETPRFKEMSQDEFVEQQRARRVNEFGPFAFTSTSKKSSSYTFDERGNVSFEGAKPKTWQDVRPKPKSPQPPEITHYDDVRGLYYTSRRPGQTSTVTSDTCTLSVSASTSFDQTPTTSPPPVVTCSQVKDTDDTNEPFSFLTNFFTDPPIPMESEVGDEGEDYDYAIPEAERPKPKSRAAKGPPPLLELYGGPAAKKSKPDMPNL